MPERTIAIAEIVPCPNGWDSDNCHDSGRGLNPCGTDGQHCQGDGTALQLLRPQGENFTDEALALMTDGCCACGPQEWTHRLEHGNPLEPNGSGISVWACGECRLIKAAAIAAGWGTCTAVPR